MTGHYALTFFGALAVTASLALQVFAQGGGAQPPAPRRVEPSQVRVFTAAGAQSSLDDVVAAMASADVVFLGEEHDDPGAHYVQAELLRLAHERYGKGEAKRPVVLSLEMFERDVQPVLDEYLSGQITEKHFLSASRPWNNYQADYRPLVEYAREQKLPVVAANAPQRYTNRASRLGRAALDDLSPWAKQWIAPLPYGDPDPAYKSKFEALMGGGGQGPAAHMPLHLIDAQVLWDATMAHSIAEAMKKHPGALVLHANGKFHSEERMGIPTQLVRYAPKARMIVVTMVNGDGFPAFDAEKHGKLGDFVVLTDPALKQADAGK
jgi:uncharacterized iron-regulated protein